MIVVLAVLVGSRPDGAQAASRGFSRRRRRCSRGEMSASAPAEAAQSPASFRGDERSRRCSVARVESWRAAGTRKIDLRVSQGDSGVVMRAADAGLIKSGTSTLEAALLGSAACHRLQAERADVFHRQAPDPLPRCDRAFESRRGIEDDSA